MTLNGVVPIEEDAQDPNDEELVNMKMFIILILMITNFKCF